MTRAKGFTLVEVITAIVILSFAAAFIFRAFFISLTAIDEAWDRLTVFNAMNNDISRIKLGLAKGELKLPFTSSGSVELFKKPYSFRLSAARNSSFDKVSVIKVAYSWAEGSRKIGVSRSLLWVQPYQEENRV